MERFSNHFKGGNINLAMILFILAALFSGRILLGGDDILPAGAEFFQFLISQAYYREAIVIFNQIPLWYNLISPGVPYITLTTLHNLPATLIVLIAGDILGVKIILFLTVLFGGAGMWVFSKKILEVDNLGGFLAASTYMFSGYFIVNAFHMGKIHRALGASIIPWAFLFLMLSLRHKRKSHMILAGVAMSLFLFSGSNYFFQYFFFSYAIIALHSIISIKHGIMRPKIDRGSLKVVLTIGLLFLLLSSVRLLPIIELQQHSYRKFDGYEDYSDPFIGSQLLDDYVGRLVSTELGWAFWDHYAFIGIIAVVFAILSVFHPSKMKTLLYILVCFFILYGMGRYGPFRFITPYIPLMKSLRWPGRTLQFTVFFTCALAALGFNWFQAKLTRRKRIPTALYGLVGFIIAISVSSSYTTLIERLYGYIIATNLFPSVYIVPSLLAATVAGYWSYKESASLSLRNRIIVSTLLSVNVLNLFLVNGYFVNPAPNPTTSETIKVFEWLREYDPSVYSIKMYFKGNDWGTYHYPAYKLGFIFDSYGHGPWWITYARDRNLTLYKYFITDEVRTDQNFKLVKKFSEVNHRLYQHVREEGYINISEILTDFYIYEATDALPHAFLTGEDTYRKVLDILEFTPNTILVNASSEEGFNQIVIVSNYYPGWKVKVDGGIAKPVENNRGFISSPLRPGTHSYTFIFSPTSVKIGAFLSILSIIIMLILIAKDYSEK